MLHYCQTEGSSREYALHSDLFSDRTLKKTRQYADVAQLVEHRYRKPRVTGSIPVVGSTFHCFRRTSDLALFSMAGDITNKMLLEHMQGMKSELQEQMARMQIDLQGQITNQTGEMRQGFSDTRKDIQALQEDLEATMQMVGKHDTKLARL